METKKPPDKQQKYFESYEKSLSSYKTVKTSLKSILRREKDSTFVAEQIKFIFTHFSL